MSSCNPSKGGVVEASELGLGFDTRTMVILAAARSLTVFWYIRLLSNRPTEARGRELEVEDLQLQVGSQGREFEPRLGPRLRDDFSRHEYLRLVEL